MHTLYWRASTSAFVVDLALAQAGVPVARVHVDTKTGENRTPAFLAINPLGHIPVLTLPDGTVMTESSAIVLHLVETFPAAALAPLPGDPSRPVFLRWLLMLTTTIYEAELRVSYPARYTTDPAQADGVREAAKAKQDELFAIVLRALPPRPFALGARATLLDAYLAMLAAWYSGDVGQETWRAHRRLLRQDPIFDEVWRRYFGAES
jgi:glutathione S-transferase